MTQNWNVNQNSSLEKDLKIFDETAAAVSSSTKSLRKCRLAQQAQFCDVSGILDINIDNAKTTTRDLLAADLKISADVNSDTLIATWNTVILPKLKASADFVDQKFDAEPFLFIRAPLIDDSRPETRILSGRIRKAVGAYRNYKSLAVTTTLEDARAVLQSCMEQALELLKSLKPTAQKLREKDVDLDEASALSDRIVEAQRRAEEAQAVFEKLVSLPTDTAGEKTGNAQATLEAAVRAMQADNALSELLARSNNESAEALEKAAEMQQRLDKILRACLEAYARTLESLTEAQELATRNGQEIQDLVRRLQSVKQELNNATLAEFLRNTNSNMASIQAQLTMLDFERKTVQGVRQEAVEEVNRERMERKRSKKAKKSKRTKK